MTASEQRMTDLDSVLELAQKNDRVCPRPMKWQEMYEMLLSTRRIGSGWEPALPLILAAWSDTPAPLKMMRLREHIEWAAAHGCLDEIRWFLASLSEDQWHHIGE
jgi:hypothetical protein